MNSATQLNSEMTLRDWEEFFMHPDRDDTKLNCISLEFLNKQIEFGAYAATLRRAYSVCREARSFENLQS